MVLLNRFPSLVILVWPLFDVDLKTIIYSIFNRLMFQFSEKMQTYKIKKSFLVHEQILQFYAINIQINIYIQ